MLAFRKDIMKNILLYCLFICILNSGCKKDFLGRAPISDTDTENFYRSPEDMLQAVNAAYSYLRENGQYGQTLYAVGEVASDNTEILDAQAGIDISQIDDFTTLTNNGLLDDMWNHHYKGILSCNAVIDRIGNVAMDEALKNRYIAEARFLRALMYFNMVRTFGDIPLVTKEILKPEEGYAYTRNLSTEVYEQIITDLEFAAQTLPIRYAAADLGRATAGAARGLLAKVYLTRQNWEQAATQAKLVIDLGIYMLMPEYADVFAISNKNGPESLFEVQYKKGGYGLGSPFNNRFAPRQSGQLVSTIGAGTGHNHPTAEMASVYEVGDKRKEAAMAEGYQNGNQFVAVRYVKKYLDPALFEAGDADNNWPILRYADILLMRAEALNELGYTPNGEAFELLNQIRKRAGLSEKDATTLPDQVSFRDALAQERRVELAYENHRWFDLVRTGRALEVLGQKGENIQSHQLLFPIPQVQIDINPDQIKQNPGY
ncbi:Starch-binding associating with outer membrane [Olivibacter domesticus]|uniref:Starch-binding associating with outer membrane n=2 Tax=Olivibacter domesticus TaxID=407022 RepID=A0A1H7URK1_OLID1|nr:Starch-binding associating with outer membrane [Olivibacter domesticus]